MSDNIENYDVYRKLTNFLLDSDCVCGSGDIAHIGEVLRQCRSCGDLWGIDDSSSHDQVLIWLKRIVICKVCQKTDEPEEHLIFIDDRNQLEILCTTCGHSVRKHHIPGGNTAAEIETPCRYNRSLSGDDTKENKRCQTISRMKNPTSITETSPVGAAVSDVTNLLSTTASRLVSGGVQVLMRSATTDSENESVSDALLSLTVKEVLPVVPQLGMSLGAVAGMLLFKSSDAATVGGAMGQKLGTEAAALVKKVIEKKN